MSEKKFFWELTETQKQQILEMYDYCDGINNFVRTDDLKIIEDNGLLSMTSVHWFQLLTEYIAHTLLKEKFLIQNTFYTRCLQFKTMHPVDFLYEKYQAILNNEPLNKVTVHEYMKKVEAKESKKKKK